MFVEKMFRRKCFRSVDVETRLSRCLSLFDLILLTTSAMIGSGIYVLTGVVAKELTGPSIIFSNVFAGLVCLSGWKIFAESRKTKGKLSRF